MKKQDIINLIRYHVEKNEDSFVAQVAEIANDFERNGDEAIAQYVMDLVSSANVYVPQSGYKNLRFLRKISYSTKPLLLPEIIREDIFGVINAIRNNSGLSKFLFYGAPGTGKTESAYQIARILDRDLLYVSAEQLVDSRLGETAKNVSLLFDEINHLPYGRVIVLFDEIDSLVLDRINRNDLREMGRVTSIFIKGLETLNENIVIIATTNLFKNFDKALIRRFDATVSFDRYSKEDLIDIADSILTTSIKRTQGLKQNLRLFNKILNKLEQVPLPGDLKQIVQTAVLFSNTSNEYDYLRRLYRELSGNSTINLQELKNQGYTTREIEILSRIPKSSVSRKLKEALNESNIAG